VYEATSAVPVRWTAPETLLDLIVTKASDCYSLGVTFHEVFSFAGELPYSNCETNARVTQFVGDGGAHDPAKDGMPSEFRVGCHPVALGPQSARHALAASEAATKLSEKSRFLRQVRSMHS
jgi:Protein tyrosine and serine/threonine kinase